MGQWRYSLMTDKLTAAMKIAERVYSLAQEQNDATLMVGAYAALSARSTIWVISNPRDNTRPVVFRSGAQEASSLMRKTFKRPSSAAFAMAPCPSGISERSPLVGRAMDGSDLTIKGAERHERISHGAKLGSESRLLSE